MKGFYTLLAAAILVVVVASVALIGLREPSLPLAVGGNRPIADSPPSGPSAGESPLQVGADHPRTQTGLSVTSPEKVVLVREAFRQALEEKGKNSRAVDGQSSASPQSGTSPGSFLQSTPAVGAPSVNTALPDESVIVDQPRLWLPAAMLEPDESIPITSELQVAEWEQLQEEFVQAVDGRAPSNANEKEAWIRAQQENDDLFRAKFGWDAFRQQQLKAYMEGLAPAPAP